MRSLSLFPLADEAASLNQVYLKEVDRPRYRPGLVVEKMQNEGFVNFGMTKHTDLWAPRKMTRLA